MKSAICSMKNRFPFAMILAVGSLGADAIAPSGEVLCSVRNGIDAQGETGAKYQFSLEPIPKGARRWKQCPKSGAIVKDEKFAERSESMKDYFDEDRILSEVELHARGAQGEPKAAPEVPKLKKSAKK